MNSIKHLPVEFFYTMFALAGGVARYLNGYIEGKSFNFSMFLASTIVSAFSGLMFSILGSSLSLPINIQFMMAGLGGFFGDQTMKLILDYVSNKYVK